MSYIGVKAKIPLGNYGLYTDVSPDQIPPGALVKAENVSFINGNVQKAPGTIKWNATAVSAGIIAAYHWKPDSTTERFIVATSDGNIYKGRDRTFGDPINSTIASTFTPNCIFVEGGSELATSAKKLFFFTDGRTNPYVLSGDGSGFGVITNPSSDWTSPATYPKFGLIHRDRLWAFIGQQSYASNTTNHENFTTGHLTEAVYPGEGGELRGGFVFKGRLLVFKQGGFAYMLNDTDVSTGNWYWQKIASNFGLSAPNAIAEVLDDLMSGNNAGTITSYAASEKLGSIEAGDIIQELQFETHLRGKAGRSGNEVQHMLYYAEKKLLFTTYRTGHYTYNNMLLVLDFGRRDVVRPAYWLKGYPTCLALFEDINHINRPMYGDKDGFLHIMDREDRNEAGTAYTGDFQIASTDFSYMDPKLSSAEKHFDMLAIHYVPESSSDLSCDYFIDGRYIETITFPMVQYLNPKLGVFTLGTDRLAQATTETTIRPIAGSGRTFSARLYNAASNKGFQITALTVYFRGGGDKAQQV